MKKTLAVLAALVLLPAAAHAQKPMTEGSSSVEKATIIAIDHDKRMVTLKDKEGNEETIQVGPEVKRFPELKVGDVITFRYYESTVYAIRKPGAPSGLPKDSERTVVAHKSARPGATVSEQSTATVTVKAIDTKVPSITVLTEDGRKASFKIEDKKALKGVKVEDKIEITYTEAVVMSVD